MLFTHQLSVVLPHFAGLFGADCCTSFQFSGFCWGKYVWHFKTLQNMFRCKCDHPDCFMFLFLFPLPTSFHTQPGESWWICECVKAVCVEDDKVQLIPVVCDPPPKPTCANGLSPVQVIDEDGCCWHWECDCKCICCGIFSLLSE